MGRRALSIQNLIDYTPKTLGFTGRWLDAMGDPEPYGSWIIWGASGNGKTRFAVQLVKYLMSFEGLRIAYNGLEEGMSETYRRAIIDTGLQMEKQSRYVFWDGFDYEDMMERLKRKRSPNVVVIDSLQYLNITYDQYKELVRKYPKKLFIWISHESGTEPKGGTAQSIKYNSNIKIRVHNYYATIISRYKGKEVFDIWPEKHINR
ncbi:MAG: hypothetical protein IKV31_05350 [Paludibacteraceae bacterium]|jgi:hypothetical protein|nr:hypothetical protein [Paludibacteraceae bacterium]